MNFLRKRSVLLLWNDDKQSWAAPSRRRLSVPYFHFNSFTCSIFCVTMNTHRTCKKLALDFTTLYFFCQLMFAYSGQQQLTQAKKADRFFHRGFFWYLQIRYKWRPQCQQTQAWWPDSSDQWWRRQKRPKRSCDTTSPKLPRICHTGRVPTAIR